MLRLQSVRAEVEEKPASCRHEKSSGDGAARCVACGAVWCFVCRAYHAAGSIPSIDRCVRQLHVNIDALKSVIEQASVMLRAANEKIAEMESRDRR